jgi:hypothetical protein
MGPDYMKNVMKDVHSNEVFSGISTRTYDFKCQGVVTDAFWDHYLKNFYGN